jgi:hypothetical protein
MFIFKKQKIVVDCFTSSKLVHDLFPIAPAKKHIPEWWKRLPVSYPLEVKDSLKNIALTMKKCPGAVDLFTTGFILPLWSDLIVTINAEENDLRLHWQFASQDPTWFINTNDYQQFAGAFDGKFVQAKITVPWFVKEKTGVKFALIEPTWSINNPNSITIPPGVLDFKYQNNINVNFFVEKTNTRLHLEAGQPLAHFIPVSEKTVEIKTHQVSNEEYQKLYQYAQPFQFSLSHITRSKIIDSKCPFSWSNK